METIKLNIEDCEKIRRVVSNKPYDNTKPGSNYEGKFYHTYACDGKVFTVMTEEKFNTDYDNDDLFEVTLEPRPSDVEGELWYSYSSHRSIKRAVATHKTKVLMKAYTVEFVQSSVEVSKEELADL